MSSTSKILIVAICILFASIAGCYLIDKHSADWFEKPTFKQLDERQIGIDEIKIKQWQKERDSLVKVIKADSAKFASHQKKAAEIEKSNGILKSKIAQEILRYDTTKNCMDKIADCDSIIQHFQASAQKYDSELLEKDSSIAVQSAMILGLHDDLQKCDKQQLAKADEAEILQKENKKLSRRLWLKKAEIIGAAALSAILAAKILISK